MALGKALSKSLTDETLLKGALIPPSAAHAARAVTDKPEDLSEEQQESQMITGDPGGMVPDRDSDRLTPPPKRKEEPQNLDGFDYLADAVKGIPRGLMGVPMGIYDFLDLVTFDILPDWKTNPLGKSQTAIGGFVEGAISFATIFIPVGGWLKAASYTGKLGKLGKTGRLARKFNPYTGGAKASIQSGGQIGSIGGRVTRELLAPKILTKGMEKSLRAQDLHLRANLVTIGRNVIASKVATALAFRGDEGRLSDLVQQFPMLENPVSEFLATDPNFDDTKLGDRAYGRFQNVMEDLVIDGLLGVVGIGGKTAIIGMSKGMSASVRMTKRARAMTQKGASEADIVDANRADAEVVIDAADDAAEVRQRALDGTEGPARDPNTHPEDVSDDLWAAPEQDLTSGSTSINKNKIPALFNNKNVLFKSGGVNADIGGGKFPNVINLLRSKFNVQNIVVDPFNQAKDAYQQAVASVRGGQADTATVSNVLNVIKEPQNRSKVIAQAADAIKPEGSAYFTVYQSNKVGRSGKDSWQEGRPLKDYVREIEQHFDRVEIKNQVIIARSPKKPKKIDAGTPKPETAPPKNAIEAARRADLQKAKVEEQVIEIRKRLDDEGKEVTARVREAKGEKAKGKIRAKYKKMLIQRLRKEMQPGGRYPGHRGKEGRMPPHINNSQLRQTLAEVEAGMFDLTKVKDGATELTFKGRKLIQRIASDMDTKYGAKVWDEDGRLVNDDLRRTVDALHDEEKEYLRSLLKQPITEGGAGLEEALISSSEVIDAALSLAENVALPGGGVKRSLTADQQKKLVLDFINNFSNEKSMADLVAMSRLAEGDSERLIYTTHLVKAMQQVYYEEVGRLARQFAEDPTNEELGRMILASIFDLTQLRRSWKQFGSNTGSALQARQISSIDEHLRGLLNLDPGELVDKVAMAKVVADLKADPAVGITEKQVLEWQRSNSLFGKFMNATNEAFSSFLISSVKTIAGVNTIGNMFSTYYFPLEKLVSHGVRAPFNIGHKELAMEAAIHLTKIQTAYGSGITALWRALKAGESLVIPGSSYADTAGQVGTSVMKASQRPPRSISSAALGKQHKGEWGMNLGAWRKAADGSWEFEPNWAGSVVDWMGLTVNLPGRVMGAFDDAFKTINAEAYIKARAASAHVKRMEGAEINWHGKKKTQGELTPAQKDLEASGQPSERSSRDLPPGQHLTNEEITWEVENQVLAKLRDENGTLYTKATVRQKAIDHLRQLKDENGKQVHQVTDAAFQKEVERLVDETWNPQAGAIGQAAADYALKTTWQTEIPDSARLAKAVQKLLKDHPMGRLVVPFLKTPYNLLSFVFERSSPGGLTKFINAEKMAKKHLNNGDIEGARPYQQYVGEYIGRMSAGVMFYGTGVYLANAGLITGSGPKDRNLRLTMIDSGWQPYSFKFGDTYVSYQRLEPISTFFGVVADLVERNNHAYDNDYDETATETMIASILFSLSENLANKSYLMGIGNIFQAVQEADRYGADVFHRMAASFIPFSSALYQSKQTRAMLSGEPDLQYQHARGLLDHFAIKSGFFDDKVSLRYNLLGEPVKRPTGGAMDIINPINFGLATNDPVRNAFAELKLTAGPPKAKMFGVLDLRDEYRPGSSLSFYDFWQEQTGKMKIGGRTLHQTLLRIVRSPEWRRLPKSTPEGLRAPASDVITGELHKFRKAALEKALKTYTKTNEIYQQLSLVKGDLKEQTKSIPFRTRNQKSNNLNSLLSYN